MSDHPCSCGTCDKRATDICPLSKVANNIGRHGDYDRIVSVIRLVGCLSHPITREYLNKEVIEELEQRHKISSDRYHDVPAFLATGNIHGIRKQTLDEVIKLLKEGAKK